MVGQPGSCPQGFPRFKQGRRRAACPSFLSECSIDMHSLDLSVSHLDPSGQLLAKQQITIHAGDDAESLIATIKEEFDFDDAVRIKLCYEKERHDPDDPPTYVGISPVAVMNMITDFINSRDTRRLIWPLENDKLELCFNTVQRAGSRRLSGAGSSGHTATGTSSGAAAGDSAAAGGSNTTSSSGKKLTQMKKKLRLALKDRPAGAEASPAGRGRGKKQQQPYARLAHKLMRDNLIRANDGSYYLRGDKLAEPGKPPHITSKCVPAGRLRCALYWLAGVQTVKDLGHDYVCKEVMVAFKVPEELVKECVNT